MKSSFVKRFSLLMLFVMIGCSAMAQGKVATVDMRKLIDKYWKRPQAEQALKEKKLSYEKDGKTLVDDFKKSNEEYEKLVASANDQSVTPAEREKRKSAAEAKLLDLQTQKKSLDAFSESASNTLAEMNKRAFDKIVQEIRAQINAFAKNKGYSMVVDSAAEGISQLPIMLYNNGENDITDTILTQLNASAPAGTDTNSVPDRKK